MSRNTESPSRPVFRALPEGVVELVEIAATDGSIVKAKDGSLMLIQGGGVAETVKELPTRIISTDGGMTWSEPTPLKVENGAGGVIRLQSGMLGMYGQKGSARGSIYFSSSPDDGETWTAPVDIGVYQGFNPMHHSMIQLAGGRLLLVGYWGGLDYNVPDVLPLTQCGWGLWRGLILFCEGHRGGGVGLGIAYYSDDEGRTWRQCDGGLYGWFDERGIPNGEGGILEVAEPTAAETQDGRVLMFLRSKVGRLLQSYCLNGGKTWLSVLPTELSSSQSPPLLIRIPKTGDLLCVWNQVSCEEIRRGFLRGRLSAAISRDSGLTWENFKTLELQEGMADVARIAPEFPIARQVVGRPGLGQLPDGFAMFTYPNVDIVDDTVFVRYSRTWPKKLEGVTEAATRSEFPSTVPEFKQGEAKMQGEWVMRIYPLEWFYK